MTNGIECDTRMPVYLLHFVYRRDLRIFSYLVNMYDMGLTVYKYFFALARTRASKTGLLIEVCAVWNGFIAVWRVELNAET
jgi:hypothetical protein